MFKRNLLTENIRLSLLASVAILSPVCALNAYAAEETQSNQENDKVEVIQVTGIISSLKESSFLKMNSNQIMDAISAEDIGQLPDSNMAEALQRIAGVQIGRDETGAGSGFQVRGLSQNRVELDGQTIAGSGENRSNSFGSLDSALFGGIEVFKSQMADMTEGAIGATVRLKTREPLSFKKPTFNITGSVQDDELADDLGQKISAMGATKFDLDSYGEFGVLVNISSDDTNRATHTFSSNWQLANEDQLEGSDIFLNESGLPNNIYRPQNLELKQQGFDESKLGATVNLQWAISSEAEISFSANTSRRERYSTTNQMQINTGKNILARDEASSDVFDAPVILGPFVRGVGDGLFVRICDLDLNKDGEIDESCYTPATGNSERFILQNGVIDSEGSEQTVLNLISKEDIEEVNTFTLSGEFLLTDTLSMNTAYSTSKSTTEASEYNLRYKPTRNGVANYEDSSGSDLNQAVNDSAAYFAYNEGQDVPDFGVYALRQTDAEGNTQIVQDAFNSPDLYTLETLNPKDRKFENTNNSLSIDFDWDIDGDVFTTVEFGARLAKNQISREEYEPEVESLAFNRYSIFSFPWRESDQDFSTRRVPDAYGGAGTPNQRPDIAFIDRVMMEEYGYDGNYLSRFVSTTEPFFPKQSDNVNVPQWITFDMKHADLKQATADFFPGRDGNCKILNSSFNTTGECGQLVDLNEPDYLLESALRVQLPSGSPNYFNQAYAYLIEEDTTAVYLKFNFDSEFMDIPYVGNFGVRYVQTDTDSLGTTRQTYTVNTKEIKDIFNEYVEQINPIQLSNSYSNVLPSANINFKLKDNLFMRFAAAKTMSRPNPSDLSPSYDIQPNNSSKTIGNPNLEAQLAWNYDASWEWYLDDVNMFSAALFYKELENFLEDVVYTQPSAGDLDNDGLNNDVVIITQKQNGGKGRISGIELSMNHTMDYLPGLLDGFGVQANYTYTDSSQKSGSNDLDGSVLPVPDLSENNYNLIIFYDKNNFNFRAAYNFRDESYKGAASSSEDLLFFEEVDNPFFTEKVFNPYGSFVPVWNDEFQTLDISMSYTFKGFRVFLQGTNVLNEVNRSYVGLRESTKMLTRDYRDTGAAYVLGVSYTF